MAGIALKIKSFFSNGHERTIKAKKNIAISFLLRGINIIVGFVLIPLTIHYVNPTQYGIWLTLSSIIAWFNFFDIGLGNGLKNKLAEANAIGDSQNARTYVSTTYAILAIIAFSILIIFLFLNQFIDWSVVLNTKLISYSILSELALIIVTLFCIQFTVQLINVVLTANHEPSKVSLISVIGQTISLCIIFVLATHTQGSLLKLVFVLGGIPVLIQLLSSIWLYNTSYKSFAPSFKYIEFKYARSLLKVGSVFFVIQIGALILFQTDNIVITQLYGPKQVTVFNIAYKLFSAITMVFTIVVTPLWSAFTDAYTKGDLPWIRLTLAKMKRYWVALSIASIVLLIFSPIIYGVWLHHKIEVPFFVSVAMALQVIAYCWQTIHVFFLNGISKIRLQLYLVVISALINLPLSIILGKYLGVPGVTLANVIVFIFLGIVFSIQTKKIVNGTALGIWNK